MKPLVIYNLFPKLCGSMNYWHGHIDRAASMKFNWLYVNPVQYSGFSGSTYSIKEHYRITPMFLDENNGTEEEQLKKIIQFTHSRGMKIMTDLVINHTAIDCPLIQEHPEWFRKNPDGTIYNPRVIEGDPDGEHIVKAVWGDLAEVDNDYSSDRENLWNYWIQLVEYFIDLGFDGFRCDAAYMVPTELWGRIIESARIKKSDVLFCAETLGCEIDKVIELAKQGFEYTFNSSKYWDFKEDWCMKQYWMNAEYTDSIAFAESHDTERLFAEYGGNQEAVKMKYLFSAVFSSGVMMPIGFEYGFQKKIDVVKTSFNDWEEKHADMCDYIRQANELKYNYRVFTEDNPCVRYQCEEEQVIALLKTSIDGHQRAMIIINTDGYTGHRAYFKDLYNVFGSSAPIKDISLENPMADIPREFEYHLNPSQIRILIQDIHR